MSGFCGVGDMILLINYLGHFEVSPGRCWGQKTETQAGAALCVSTARRPASAGRSESPLPGSAPAVQCGHGSSGGPSARHTPRQTPPALDWGEGFSEARGHLPMHLHPGVLGDLWESLGCWGDRHLPTF